MLREITDRVSRTRVRFRKPVEMFGCPIVAAATAWVAVCFTATALHTAAVPRDFIQPTPEARMFFGLAPDRRWLPGCGVDAARAVRPAHQASTPARRPRRIDFIIRYADRRKQLEGAEPELR